ncbi:MAG TPA: hypothetical protein VIK89_03515 [Cytophagaceae bacterium]
MKKLLLIATSLFLSYSIYAQTDDDDLKAMFDDGNISTSKNVLKINSLAWPAGDLPIHYERVLLEVLSVEVGVGYILDMETIEIQIPYEDRVGSKGNGYSLWVNPRLFLTGNAPEGYYMGMLYRRRAYSFEYTYNDYVIINGIQSPFAKGRFMVDFMYGFGLRFVDSGLYQSSLPSFNKMRMVFPTSVKLGYKF